MFNETYSPNSTVHVIKNGDTLWMLSQTYGVSVQSILAANPGVDASNLQIGSTLYIPSGSDPSASSNTCPDGTFPYIIQAGDTLWIISQTYGISVQSILDFNPGINPQNLQIGSTLCIPASSSPTTPITPLAPSVIPSQPSTPAMPAPSASCPNGTFPYTVQAGDTLWMISQTYGVSVQSILDLNPGTNPQNLQVGSTLCIPATSSLPTPISPPVPPVAPSPPIPSAPPVIPSPPPPVSPVMPSQTTTPTIPAPSVTCPNGAYSYTVQAGDTLWMISQTYGVSIQRILDLNPGTDPQNLQIGSTLCIPAPSTPSNLPTPIAPPVMPILPSAPIAPVMPSPPVTCPNGTFPYTIQSGDTLWMISQTYGVSIQRILDLNPGTDPQNLQIGSTLCIPLPLPSSPSTPSSPDVFPYLIKKCDSLHGIAKKFYVSPESILQKNPGINPRRLQAGTYIYIPINCCGENTCRYMVRERDTLNSIANKFSVCPLDLITANPNIDFQHLVRCQVICIPTTRMC